MSEPSVQHSFWAALGVGDIPRVRELLGAGADVNQPIGNPGGETPLIRAIGAGNLELVQVLLEMGADVNRAWTGPKAWTPLMFAHNQPALLRELLARGANPNARAAADSLRAPSGRMVRLPGGQTALHLAAVAGNAEAVRALIQGGAEVEARAEDGCAPLDYAVRAGTVTEAAEVLVQAGAQLTPERLATMHAAASSPESDLLSFPVSTTSPLPANPPSPGPGPIPRPRPPMALTTPPTEARCPKCHALLYSRRSKLCGSCGALLPAELLLTDQEAQARDDQRAWARALADKFTERPSGARRSIPDPDAPRTGEEAPAGTPSPQDLLRRVSCVEEFKHRPRPYFWLSFAGCAFLYAALALVLVKAFGDITRSQFSIVRPRISSRPWSPVFYLLAAATFGFTCFQAWRRSSPLCPNCKQNIRLCAAEFCHVCGERLNHGRCSQCGVDSTWTGLLRPYSNPGRWRFITFCPGCGVRLETRIARSRTRF